MKEPKPNIDNLKKTSGTRGTPPSLSSRLTISLFLTVAVVLAITITLIFWFTARREKNELHLKADKYLSYLTGSLVIPLWNFNGVSVEMIGNAVSQDELFVNLKITDSKGKTFFLKEKNHNADVVFRTGDILHNKQLVGKVVFSLTKQEYQKTLNSLLSIYIAAMLSILIPLILVTGYFIRSFLQKPLKTLNKTVDSYSQGNYISSSASMPYSEFLPFENVLMQMGEKINEQINELQESEKKYRDLFNSGDDAIFLVSVLDGNFSNFIDVNDIACKRYGYTREEFLKLMPSDISKNKDNDNSPTFDKRSSYGDSVVFEITHLTKDGTLIPVEINSTTIEFNGKPALFAVARDITERKLSEQKQKESEDKYRMLFNSGNDAILVHRIKEAGAFGFFMDVNEIACKRYGYTKEDFLKITPSDLNESLNHEEREMIKKKARYSQSSFFETIHRRKDGTTFPVEVNNSVIEFEGKPALMSIVRDITERKLAEDALREYSERLEEMVEERTYKLETANKELEVQAIELSKAKESAEDAARVKSDFLARMSHEIRTPMNAIIGLTNIVLKSDLSENQRDHLLKTHESSQHLLKIINDILDFSKIEAGKMEIEVTDFMLHHVIDRMANMFRIKAAEKRIELFYLIGRQIPLSLRGDPLRLGQILINLISNAVKFTDKGEIIVKVTIDKEDSDLLDDSDQVSLIFSIKDSGVGIAPEKKEVLFEPFTQTDGTITRKYGGTGLGLSISYRLVQMMGGEIWVESELGKGSVFHFSISFDRQDEEKSIKIVSPPDIKGMKVLVVDDNETARHIMTEILQGFDLQVTTLESGKEAVDELKQADPPFELVVLDWKMPEIDGFELAKTIHTNPVLTRNNALPKIIMATMYGHDDIVFARQNSDAYIDACILKPISSSEIFNTIMEVFGQKDAMIPRLVFEPESGDILGIEGIRGARLLLVEDNPINQQVALAVLNNAGFNIELAENGQEALNALERHSDQIQPYYDAVLMDIEMPVMDGLKAGRIIRKNDRYSQLPIIAMTAHALEGDRERCLAAGMNDYVSKPVDERELFSTMIRWIKPGNREYTEQISSAKNFPEEPWENMPDVIPGIDIKAALNRIHGNTGLFKNMLQNFMYRFKGHETDLKGIIDSGKIDEAKRLLHSIKGISGNICSIELFQISNELEKELRDEKIDQTGPMIDKFHEQLSMITEAIEGLDLDMKTTETFTELSPEIKPDEMEPLLNQMKFYLDSSSSRIRHVLPLLKKALKGPRFREELGRLERAIYMLESEKALSCLSKIADQLGFQLSKE